ncbi:MAG: GNAT family N-acetyltransferase [Vulcanimicrobiota bacterium]
MLLNLKLHRHRLLVVACHQDRVVGFKLGFCERPGVFYSWLGAVDADFEGQGIGRRLLELQHERLQERGYHLVRTATRNRFKRMLILNLLNGFDLVGVRNKDGDAHLQLEKRLSPAGRKPKSSPAPA